MHDISLLSIANRSVANICKPATSCFLSCSCETGILRSVNVKRSIEKKRHYFLSCPPESDVKWNECPARYI